MKNADVFEGLTVAIQPGYILVELTSLTGFKDIQHLRDFCSFVLKARGSSEGKLILALPPDFNISKQFFNILLTFLNKAFGSQFGCAPLGNRIHRNGFWDALIAQQVLLTEHFKLLKWGHDEIPKGSLIITEIDKTIYFKCHGNLDEDNFRQNFSTQFGAFLKKRKPVGKLLKTPVAVSLAHGSVWSPLQQALIIDLADAFFLSPAFCQHLQKVLAKYRLRPDSKGVYFVVSGEFQACILQQRFGPRIHFAGNIMRVLKDPSNNCQEEARLLCQKGLSQNPPIPLLLHQVNSVTKGRLIINRYFPDLVIFDEEQDYENILYFSGPGERTSIVQILPQDDASFQIIGPGYLLPDYDVNHFAEHVFAEYRNHRLRDGAHWIIHFSLSPVNLRRGWALFLQKAEEVITAPQKKLLQAIEGLEHLTPSDPKLSQRATFLVTKSATQAEQLRIILPVDDQGSSCFFDHHDALFSDHFKGMGELLAPLLRDGEHLREGEFELNLINQHTTMRLKKSWLNLKIKWEEHQQVLLQLFARPLQISQTKMESFFTKVFLWKRTAFPHTQHALQEAYQQLCESARLVAKNGVLRALRILLSFSPDAWKIEIFRRPNEMCNFTLEEEIVRLAGKIPGQTRESRYLQKIIRNFFVRPAPAGEIAADQWCDACVQALEFLINQHTQGVITYACRVHRTAWLVSFCFDKPLSTKQQQQLKQMLYRGIDSMALKQNGCQLALKKNPRRPYRVLQRTRPTSQFSSTSLSDSPTKPPVPTESSGAVLPESSEAVFTESSEAVLTESSEAVLTESSEAVLTESSDPLEGLDYDAVEEEQFDPEEDQELEQMVNLQGPKAPEDTRILYLPQRPVSLVIQSEKELRSKAKKGLLGKVSGFFKKLQRHKRPERPKPTLEWTQEQLQTQPQWQIFAMEHFWICPYCGETAANKKNDWEEFKRLVLAHLLLQCPNFEDTPKSVETLCRHAMIYEVENNLKTSPVWQKRDQDRIWYCPYCLQATGITWSAAGIDAQIVTNIIAHLEQCPHYQQGQGVVHLAAEIDAQIAMQTRCRQFEQRLAQNITQDMRWCFKDRADRWLCPYCLTSTNITVPDLATLQQKRADIVGHLFRQCLKFNKGQGQMQTTSVLSSKGIAITAQSAVAAAPTVPATRSPLSSSPAEVPALPQVPGFEFAACYRSHSESCGDFYDFISLGEGKLALVIGDVSSHGADDHLMSTSKNIIATVCRQSNGPAEILNKVNTRLRGQMAANTFVSVFLGVLDTTGPYFTFARAGHNPLLLYNPARNPSLQVFNPAGMIVGKAQEDVFMSSLQEYELQLIKGDVLLLYNDGVIEAQNSRQEEFGSERLHHIIKEHGRSSLQTLLSSIEHHLIRFTGSPQFANDITMLSLSYRA